MALLGDTKYSGVFFEVDGGLERHFDDETLRIEPWGENSLRIRATKEPAFSGEPWALLPPAPCKAEIEIETYTARLRNGGIEAEISSGGKLTLRNGQGKILLEEYIRNRKDPHAAYCSALEVEPREFCPILGGDYTLRVRFESAPEEKLYGMGQYQMPHLDLKGCDLELAQRNSQASVPFLLSSLGYGFLWNNPGVGRVCFGKNLTTWEARSTREMDYWVTAGDSPAQIEEAYARATGTVPEMPDFAKGFWQCKLRYRTQEELLNVAREYKRLGVPVSVIVVDFFHWPHQGDWKFDPDYWPDPEGMIRQLKEMGMELMVSIWPTVDQESENYTEMLKKGLLIRADRGLRIAMDFIGNTVHFDATRPEARQFIWQKAKQNYFDKGVKLFWLDEAEPEYSRYDFDLYRYYLGPNLRVGNIYPAMYAKAFFDGMRSEGVERPINLLRCAWAGSQRYGALVWSGDIHSSFASLRNQLAAGLNMGLAGIPWWTTDIGGFHGGDPKDPAFRELLVRWFEYGAFCPVMRLHGDREPSLPPIGEKGGGICSSGSDNEIWSYGEENYGILRDHILLRERMRPYIDRIMREAHEKGTPVIRPLFYDFPKDPAAWNVEDQFFFGPDLLIAPVLHAGERERNVYLPTGADWVETHSGKTYPGGQTVLCQAPIERIPVFVRKGAELGFSVYGE